MQKTAEQEEWGNVYTWNIQSGKQIRGFFLGHLIFQEEDYRETTPFQSNHGTETSEGYKK